MNNFENLGRPQQPVQSHGDAGAKPLGQVAMEAFYESRFPHVRGVEKNGPHLRWSHMDEQSKRAWECAAQAVYMIYRGSK
jgi:hypothetical protein